MNTLASSPAKTSSLPSADSPPMPVPLRVLRVIALVGLAAIFSLIVGLALFSLFPIFHQAFESLVTWVLQSADSGGALIAGLMTVGLIILVTTSVLLAAWKLKLRSWWWIAGGYLAVAPVLAYLATDDPVYRRPVTVEELAPPFPGAEKSFDVLMRYGKQHPLGRDFKEQPSLFAGKSAREPGPWREILLTNRAAFESRWAGLAPVRAWWTELNAFDRIGDLTPARNDAEILAFHPFRAMSQTGCAVAGLRAIDGRGDEAIDVLIPLIQVGRKIQPSARTLVRVMIGIVIERMSLETAGFVLDTTTVSDAARARLAAVLQGGNAEAAARRLLIVDYVMTMGSYTDQPLGNLAGLYSGQSGWLRHPLNLLSPFVYNPRASFNIYGEFITDLADLLARREIGKFGPREIAFHEREARPRFKNFMGSLLVRHVVPAYSKVSDAFWKTHDERVKLAARVAKG